MKKDELVNGKVVIVTADKNKYLALADIENSEEIIGTPKRITICEAGIVPNFEEREVSE